MEELLFRVIQYRVLKFLPINEDSILNLRYFDMYEDDRNKRRIMCL